ncbi:MAG: DNA recombination protein RmuC [Eubacteriales bacterium]
MTDYIIIALGIIVLILQLVIILKKPSDSPRLTELSQRVDTLSQSLKAELQSGRQEQAHLLELFASRLSGEFHTNRQESSAALRDINERIIKIQEINSAQSDRLSSTLIQSVKGLQESNEKKLDEMRHTVDEKLTSTLTQRLDSSFKLVGEQLKDVHRSLGEMKQLAGDVNDLQRVLTNVKARGTWAEVQLGAILEQTLTPEQFERNLSPKNNGEVVEYAVKIPSREEGGGTVWLPIDSKFPQEDYLRLCEASERVDKAGVDEAIKSLERRIKDEAAAISKLYINVPVTTDFAILFLPTEGLYAEILRRPGLAEEVQQKHRVMICGPTTITAFLNTLRMGFRTIAIDKRASEVWKVLGAVKSQYDNFENLLIKIRKKIDEAGNTLDDAQKRNNIIKRNLRDVEQLETAEADELLGIETSSEM